MVKNKQLKRRPTPFIKDKQKNAAILKADEQSASEQGVNIDV